MNESFKIYTNLLGQGAFGTVYLGLNRRTGQLVAVKTEDKAAKDAKILRNEQQILKTIGEEPLGFWRDSSRYYMVIPIMGPSLDKLHGMCGNKFTLTTTLRLGVQMINAIEHIHNMGVLHRDIKPANFLINYHLPHHTIKLVDYGLSKLYKDGHGNHISFKTGVPRVGSLRYMSKYTHQGIEGSCRDDIFSIMYVIIYLFGGSLPWRGIIKDMNMEQKHKEILQTKQQCTNKTLAALCGNSAKSMSMILDYIDNLSFGERPDYERIRRLLHVSVNVASNTWDWDKYF